MKKKHAPYSLQCIPSLRSSPELEACVDREHRQFIFIKTASPISLQADTSRTEKQWTILIVVTLFFVYYTAMGTAIYYYEFRTNTAATPRATSIPSFLIIATVNHSSDVIDDAE